MNAIEGRRVDLRSVCDGYSALWRQLRVSHPILGARCCRAVGVQVAILKDREESEMDGLRWQSGVIPPNASRFLGAVGVPVSISCLRCGSGVGMQVPALSRHECGESVAAFVQQSASDSQ